MNGLEFSKRRENLSRMDQVKSAIRMYVHIKHRLSTKHEFGLMTVTNSAEWVSDYTDKTEILFRKLDTIEPKGSFKACNMSSVFTEFKEKNKTLNTNFIYRVIFIYSRSNVVPDWFTGKDTANELLEYPLFAFDGLYLHKKPGKESDPQKVYNFITDVEPDDRSGYFFEVNASTRRLQLAFAKLLANPLQREPDETNFKCTA
eukprot:TRINITY_DN14079_c0_g1_i1.p1 TRINITY_DN14079_c0_g1~~TRINITY_DN14079_c0_g1_i1.p1  ORF type:complete len:215 (+),score=35.69 TRINITY_DN14079_c0_g1_i1:42-647(+)